MCILKYIEEVYWSKIYTGNSRYCFQANGPKSAIHSGVVKRYIHIYMGSIWLLIVWILALMVEVILNACFNIFNIGCFSIAVLYGSNYFNALIVSCCDFVSYSEMQKFQTERTDYKTKLITVPAYAYLLRSKPLDMHSGWPVVQG